jgi:hypothetical protein
LVFALVSVVFLRNLRWADTAAFDLSGPELSVTVSRSGKSFPISKLPNLQPNDRIRITSSHPRQANLSTTCWSRLLWGFDESFFLEIGNAGDIFPHRTN